MAKMFRGCSAVCLAAWAVTQFATSPGVRASARGVVISQVYGGGGANSGTPSFKNDFIELFNASAAPVDVTGWTVQYAASTGTTWTRTVLAGTIQPGRYYLVQEAGGGLAPAPLLPATDAAGTITMAQAAGKVALVSANLTLQAGACPAGSAVVDFVGYGVVNCAEGSPTGAIAAPGLSIATAAIRAANGCTDTDQNDADFSAGTPTPHNSASPASPCGPPIVPIHDIQGDGAVSPLAGQALATRGVVTGVKTDGFFMQAQDGDIDANPGTSEGLFVFTPSSRPAAALVGNLVVVTGTVQEYTPAGDGFSPSMTEIGGESSVTFVSAGQPLPAPVTISAADLSPAGSILQLEKFEGMRVHVDQLIAAGPTEGSVSEAGATATSNGRFVGVLPGSVRPFREAGIEASTTVPADAPSPSTIPRWDGNPERVGVDTTALSTGAALDVTTGVAVSNITGPLDYGFRLYIIDTEATPVRLSDDMEAQPVRPRTEDEFTVASMDLQRFYDTVKAPGIPDAVLTADGFAARLAKASLAIRAVLQAPDIIGVQDVENLATLQALAARVNADATLDGRPQIHYEAYLLEGTDASGLDVGFLARTDTVVVNSLEQYGLQTLFMQPDGQMAVLHDSPPLILRAAIRNAPYAPDLFTVVVTHLLSMSGIEGPDGTRIRAKRLAQGFDLASKLQALQSAGEHVISVGGYNAFDQNDGYVDLLGLVKGSEAGAAEVTLWAESPVMPPLLNLADLAQPEQRYSYVLGGTAQAIDHILSSADVHSNAIAYARMNADFPEVLRSDPGRPERLSDHDPVVGYFSLPDTDPTPPVLTLPANIMAEGNAPGGAVVFYSAAAFDSVDGSVEPVCAPASGALFALGTTTVTCTAVDAHGNVASGTFTVAVADTTPPAITAATPSPAVLPVSHHKFVPVVIAVTVLDVVDPAPVCRIAGVTETRPGLFDRRPQRHRPPPPHQRPRHVPATDHDDVIGRVDYARRVLLAFPWFAPRPEHHGAVADWRITGPLSVEFAAGRSESNAWRTYSIEVTCIDASGNVSAPAFATVSLPHDRRR